MPQTLFDHLLSLGMPEDVAKSFVSATRDAIWEGQDDASPILESWGLDLSNTHEVTPW